MAAVTKAADRHTVVTTGWTNPSNAYATTGDNVYSTAAPAKNSTVNGDFGWPAFSDAEIPVGSTIDSVVITVEWGMTAAVTGGALGVQGRNSGLADSGAEVTKTTTAEAQSTFTFADGVFEADLKTAGQITARVRCTKGNTTSAMTGNLDFVSLTVNYTAPAPPGRQPYRKLISGVGRTAQRASRWCQKWERTKSGILVPAGGSWLV